MKKNKMMRAASALMVAALLTTSVISGTFAKYVTEESGSDSARVAKWGIGAPTSLDLDLFHEDAWLPGEVLSSDSTNVVAPGTWHDEIINLITVNEAPEVRYDYNVVLTVSPADSTTIAKLDSLPGFKWTMTPPGPSPTQNKYDTFAQLQNAVNSLSEIDIEPGQLPSGYASGDNTMTIGWEWDFDDSGRGTNDTVDTAAGNAAAAGDLDTFTLTLTVSATQRNN